MRILAWLTRAALAAIITILFALPDQGYEEPIPEDEKQSIVPRTISLTYFPCSWRGRERPWAMSDL